MGQAAEQWDSFRGAICRILSLRVLPLEVLGCGLGWAIALPAAAQILPDGLNTQGIGDCSGAGVCGITGGTAAGGNLFHSFSEFSLSGVNAEARFEVGADVGSVFARVTGGKVSNLDGLLSVSGSAADLFFMNPAGVVFGPNARLNLEGSFAATTATGIGFGSSGAFDLATTREQTGLLTITPSAFLYSQIPQPIQVQPGARLELTESVPTRSVAKDLILAGGDVNVEGGVLRAPGGNLWLTGLSTPGDITIVNGEINFSDGAARSDINLATGAIVDVVAGNRGNILLYGKNINVSGSSTNICAGVGPGSSCEGSGIDNQDSNSLAGNILFDATGTVSIREARIENNLNPGSVGNRDNIFEAIESGDTDRFFGSIIILADSISLENGGTLSVSTFGEGSAGLVFLKANRAIDIDQGNIFSVVVEDATGDAGGVLIDAAQINIDSAEISTAVFGTGNGGKIVFDARDFVVIENQALVTSNLGRPTPEPGQNFATGNAGEINITAGNLVRIDGANTQVTSNSNSGAQGDSGIIFVEANDLEIRNGAKISTTAFGQGDAGVVFILASGDVLLENGAKIFANTQESATSGGVIFLVADRLIARNGSGLSSSNFANAAARDFDNDRIPTGRITEDAGATIVVARRIVLDRDSFIAALSISGEGGGVGLFTDQYTALNKNSLITTDSFDLNDTIFRNAAGEQIGGGGSIFVSSRFLSSTPRRDSDIVATAVDGKGGEITITNAIRLFDIAPRNLSDRSNDISAQSGFGINGTVSVNSLELEVRPSEPLPETRLPDLLGEGCRPTGRPVPQDKLYVTNNGGIGSNPGDILRSSTILADLDGGESPPVAEAAPPPNIAPTFAPAQPLIAAQGWVRDAQGDVYFSASVPGVPISTGPKPYSSCSAAP